MEWDWPESKISRNKRTVESRILWSYAVLSVTRQIMKDGVDVVAPLGRARAFVAEFGRMMRGEKRMGPLDREAGLLAFQAPLCAHCGALGVEMDHLIPRARAGANLGFNIVPSCARCNRSRGKTDLMKWHHHQRNFPSLAMLRHYLKLCQRISMDMDLLTLGVEEAVGNGLPFDPLALPTRLPPIEHLVWDWRFKG